MDNSIKIGKLIQLTDIVKDYIEKDSFLKEETEYLDKIVNVKDKLENRKFTVSIIAAMKAGKSTTFNALIGRDLLPNERAACTASITEIRHAKLESNYVLKKYVDGRTEKIMATNGRSLEECFHEDVRNSRKGDSVDAIEKYYVETPIKALEGSGYEELIQNFVLVDTPGPNEADIGDFDVTILQRLALDQLRNSDALIMLLDYESYKSETNAKILQDIFANREDLKAEEGKVYFLLNKIDSMGSKDGTIDEVLVSVKQLIKEYAPVITEPRVYGFSGKQAMLSRAVINNTATEDMKKQMQLDYGSRFPVIIKVGDQEIQTIPKVENFAESLLEMSRINIIEKDIISEIFSNASIDMIKNATARIEAVSNNILAKAESKIVALNKSGEEIRGITNQAKEKILNLRAQGEDIKDIAVKRLNEVEMQIYNRLEDLEYKVSDILEEQVPDDDYVEHTDKEVIEERIKTINQNCLNAIKICLVSEVDKMQRECEKVQTELNNDINIKFNKLVMEATKEANEKISFTANEFDITEIAEISRIANLQEEYQSDGTYMDTVFTGVGAAAGIGSGAAMGAALGSVVPILGTTIGAVVGGVLGLFAGATKKSLKEKTKTVYKASLIEVKQNIKLCANTAIDNTKSGVGINIKGFIDQYKTVITSAINKFIDDLDRDLDKIISDYEEQKETKDVEIAHMAEIKLDMGEVLGVVEQLK